MAGGGGSGNGFLKALFAGGAMIAGAQLGGASLPTLARGALLALGGLLVVFASCEAMIRSVSGLAARMRWNRFVAGTLGGLAGNVPELVMLGFVLAAKPRIGFVVVALTLHVGALAFGLYSSLLPRDDAGLARLPEPLVKLSTDQFAGAAGVYFATGLVMLLMRGFGEGRTAGQGLDAYDLYVIGALLLLLQVVGLVEMMKRFGAEEGGEEGAEAAADDDAPPSSTGAILGYGALGLATSVVGGHAVGDFADLLVEALVERGAPEMVGAILLSVFACAGGYVMLASAHTRGMIDLALANVSGAISQNAVLVMPVALILLGVFGQTGVIPMGPGGTVLPIDLETTAVVLLTFPPLLILWKAVKDDGRVSWLETAAMSSVFGLTLYLLARHT